MSAIDPVLCFSRRDGIEPTCSKDRYITLPGISLTFAILIMNIGWITQAGFAAVPPRNGMNIDFPKPLNCMLRYGFQQSISPLRPCRYVPKRN